jgi:hypothetical protein
LAFETYSKALKEEELICRFVSSATPTLSAIWLSLNSCVWGGPAWLKCTASLSRLFPTCETLFTTKINVSSLEISHIILEFENISTKDDLFYISSLFTLLNKQFESGAETLRAREQMSLEATNYFPIIGRGSRLREYDRLESINSENWFIPDSATLERGFNGKVDLLAFNQKEISSFLPLFGRLGLSRRLLSKAATLHVLGGEFKEDEPELTQLYRSRGKFIARYVPPEIDISSLCN